MSEERLARATAKVEGVFTHGTALLKTVALGLIGVLAIGSTVLVYAQDQLDQLKGKADQFQQDADNLRQDASQLAFKAETNEQRIARLKLELAQADQDREAALATANARVDKAQETADQANVKAEKKQPPKVIDRTVTKEVPVATPPPRKPTPTPRAPGPLGLPPLFPRSDA